VLARPALVAANGHMRVSNAHRDIVGLNPGIGAAIVIRLSGVYMRTGTTFGWP